MLNRLTNMVDAVGVTAYTYDAVGQLLSEGGLWPDDTVSFTYTNRLRRRGWHGGELRRQRKSSKDKVKIAARLRQETTMTLRRIAGQLAMGTWNNASNLLAAARGKAK